MFDPNNEWKFKGNGILKNRLVILVIMIFDFIE